jgi:hypothetical protein
MSGKENRRQEMDNTKQERPRLHRSAKVLSTLKREPANRAMVTYSQND